jgi:hypothetical protein
MHVALVDDLQMARRQGRRDLGFDALLYGHGSKLPKIPAPNMMFPVAQNNPARVSKARLPSFREWQALRVV